MRSPRSTRLCSLLGIAFGIAIVAGCGETPPPTVTQASAPDSEVFVDRSLAGDGALPGIGEVKRSAKAGEPVRFVARVGGRAACFVPSSAVFVVADPVLEDCIQKGDGCPKPWDYCCEPRERLLANTATIRIVDASGEPLLGTAEGLGGLAPLRTIEVAGTVHETGPDGLFVVDAAQIFVVPG